MLTEIINSQPKDLLHIEYDLGNLCNHRCSYCFPGSNEGTVPWPDVDLVIKNLDHLLAHYKNAGKTKFDIYLIGGEPTLWKELPKLCQYLKNNYDINIRLSTNGSRKLDWWKDNVKFFDEIEISVHHEFANVEHLSNVLDLIYDNKINNVANVLMDPDHFEKCQDIIHQLKSSKRRWTIIAKTVHFNGVTRYSESQKKFLLTPLKRMPNLFWWFSLKNRNQTKVWTVNDSKKKQVNENWFALNDLNRFQGWSCNLGVDLIKIHRDGYINGNCRQKIYGIDHFYNLYDKNFINEFSPKIIPIVCEKSICECTHEITIKKIKNA
jgi:organic radical activating enzyme